MSWILRSLGLEGGVELSRILEGVWVLTRPLAPWALWSVVAVGLVLAGLNFLPRVAMRLGTRFQTFGLRLAMTAVLLLILAGLEWHGQLAVLRTQDWLLVADDSASMATVDVNGQSRFAAARAELARLQSLAGPRVRHRVQTLSGAPLGDAPGAGPTQYEEALRASVLAGDPPDRVILLTDGRDSDGRDLRRLGDDLKARGVALDVRLLGSAQAASDRALSAEPERPVIRLGEDLLIRGAIHGQQAGEFTLTLKENDKVVRTVTLPPEEARGFQLSYRPPKAGRHLYSVELSGGDAHADNNRASFVADVLEERIKVLLLEGYPRFEFKLVKSVLEVDPMLSLVSVVHLPGGGVYVQGEPLHRQPEQGLVGTASDLFKYDVVILRDLSRGLFRAGGDTSETRLKLLVDFVTKRGGGLMVTGGQDVYRAGGYEDSHLAPILPFDLSAAYGREPQFNGMFFVTLPKPAFNHPILRLLANPAENRDRLLGLRDLDGSNNVGSFKPMATPLMTRTVTKTDEAGTKTEHIVPIMGYMAVGDGKVLASAVDTSWRWQLQPDYDDPPLSMMLANTIRFLAPPPTRRPDQPGITLAASPQVGSELTMMTELRDSNYEPVREAELVVTVTRPDGSTLLAYPRDLPDEPGTYRYAIRLDQPGRYQVKAVHGKHESTREFIAGAASGEFTDLSSDRAGMEALLKAADGAFLEDHAAWQKRVAQKPVEATIVRELEVWNSPLVLLLFLALVCLDCYLRKRQGLA